MTDMKKMLGDIARAIVDEPEAVSVEETVTGDSVLLVLTVAPDDMGKVIGKHGKIAHAIRLMMKTAASTCGKRVNVEIK